MPPLHHPPPPKAPARGAPPCTGEELCAKNHSLIVLFLAADTGWFGDKRAFLGGPEEVAMGTTRRSSSSFALMKAIALLIAFAAAGLGTTAAVASGWTLAGYGRA